MILSFFISANPRCLGVVCSSVVCLAVVASAGRVSIAGVQQERDAQTKDVQVEEELEPAEEIPDGVVELPAAGEGVEEVEVLDAVAVEVAVDEAVPAKRGRAEIAAEAAEEVGEAIGEFAEGLLEGIFGGRRGVRPAQVQARLNDNVLKQFEQQYGKHFDQLIRTELHFIRMVCDTDRKQYEAIQSDSKEVRNNVLREFAQVQQGWNRGVNQNSNNGNPRLSVTDSLLNVVKKHLTPEQAGAYQREVTARREAFNKVVVSITTTKLDRKLQLTPDQRVKVVAVLTSDWDGSGVNMQSLMYGDQYFPDLPDGKLTPLLTERQKKVWRTVGQQTQVFWGFNMGINQVVAIEDEVWDEEANEKPSDKGGSAAETKK